MQGRYIQSKQEGGLYGDLNCWWPFTFAYYIHRLGWLSCLWRCSKWKNECMAVGKAKLKLLLHFYHVYCITEVISFIVYTFIFTPHHSISSVNASIIYFSLRHCCTYYLFVLFRFFWGAWSCVSVVSWWDSGDGFFVAGVFFFSRSVLLFFSVWRWRSVDANRTCNNNASCSTSK